jgi:hypothetical protein
MTKFIKALDPKGEAKGFDDLIGAPCTVNCKGGKDKNEDGTPKYINFGGISAMVPKLAAITDELAVPGVGHVRFPDLTKEAVLELNPIREVNMILMEGENYSGSKAEEIVNAIREENPDFAVRKKKTEEGEDKGQSDKGQEKAPEKDPNLTEDEEF